MTSDLKNILISGKTTNTSNEVKNKQIPDRKNGQSEFDNVLEKNTKTQEDGIRVSNHAIKRLEERSIKLDGNEFLKIREALDKLKLKGGKDSLVITNRAAYIVDVDKQTVVTAIDKNNLGENVFTKIDSTIFIEP
jgi:flagellar operon protein